MGCVKHPTPSATLPSLTVGSRLRNATAETLTDMIACRVRTTGLLRYCYDAASKETYLIFVNWGTVDGIWKMYSANDKRAPFCVVQLP